MNSRRGFLASLISAGAVAAIDPERLLWVPGKRLISIPRPSFVSILGPSRVVAEFVKRERGFGFMGCQISFRLPASHAFNVGDIILFNKELCRIKSVELEKIQATYSA